MYLEMENVTCAQCSWGQGGSVPYLFASSGPPTTCTPQAPRPGFDSPGNDYRTHQLPAGAVAAQCEALCCGEQACGAWTFAPAAPGAYMSCAAGAPCCYIKGGTPDFTNSSVPGIVSGGVTRPPLSVAHPPSGMRSAVPLGGLGAGSFELRGDGTIHEFTAQNQAPGGAAKFGVLADALLGVRVAPAGGGGGGASVAATLRTAPPGGLPGVDALTYSGSYPVSRLAVTDAALAGAGVSATVFGYSTLVPGNMPASAAPAAVFTLAVSNTGAAAADVSFLFTLPLGGVANCGRPSGNCSSTPGTDAAACLAACAAAGSNCGSWTFHAGNATCALAYDVPHSIYLTNATCGVAGSWLSPDGASGLTMRMWPAQGAAALSPAVGDVTLTPVLPSGAGAPAGSSSVGVATTAAALWASFAATGSVGGAGTPAGFGGALGAVGGASASVTVPAGANATLSIVFSWYFPHRDHVGEVVGNFYSTVWPDSPAVAADLADEAALTGVVDTLRAHHAVFSSPDSSLPEWVQDFAVNHMSHFRHLIWTADNRLRELEANDW